MYCFCFFSFLKSFNFYCSNFYNWKLLICLIHLYSFLPKSILLYYQILNSVFGILSKVYFGVLAETKLLLMIDLFPFAKLLELLPVNNSSSEKRDIFVPRLSKLYHVLLDLQLAWVRTSPQLSWIRRSIFAFVPGCQGSYGIVPNRSAGLVIFHNIRQGLKC